MHRFSEGEDTFKLLVFAFVLLVNLHFWILWLSHFVTVLVRLHLGKVRRVCLLLGVRVLSDRQVVNTYEEDLWGVLQGRKEGGEAAGPGEADQADDKQKEEAEQKVELPEMESLDDFFEEIQV